MEKFVPVEKVGKENREEKIKNAERSVIEIRCKISRNFR